MHACEVPILTLPLTGCAGWRAFGAFAVIVKVCVLAGLGIAGLVQTYALSVAAPAPAPVPAPARSTAGVQPDQAAISTFLAYAIALSSIFYSFYDSASGYGNHFASRRPLYLAAFCQVAVLTVLGTTILYGCDLPSFHTYGAVAALMLSSCTAQNRAGEAWAAAKRKAWGKFWAPAASAACLASSLTALLANARGGGAPWVAFWTFAIGLQALLGKGMTAVLKSTAPHSTPMRKRTSADVVKILKAMKWLRHELAQAQRRIRAHDNPLYEVCC